MRIPCCFSLVRAAPCVRASARLLGAVALAGWLAMGAAPAGAQTALIIDEPAAVPGPAAGVPENVAPAPIRLGAVIPVTEPAAAPPPAAVISPEAAPAAIRLGAQIPDQLEAVVAPRAAAPEQAAVAPTPTPRRAPDLGAALPAAPTPAPPSPT